MGTGNTVVSIQITQSITQIELLEQQMNIIDENIKSIMIEMDSIIMTIPGIGLLNGAMILGEIGRCFKILESFKAFSLCRFGSYSKPIR